MLDDVKLLMKDHFLKYASYVILDRAIPNLEDGLKPVQRRILYTLEQMHDGKLHKVANVAGQTMALHPHGDAPITEALVNLSNKGYLLDQQGNFGNLLTGDPAAAARYIETRLSPLAKETLFNPDLMLTVSSYDGRHQEPVTLPAKIPVLLLQGAEGIAVGMATHILPHNFCEVLEAEIAVLEGKPFSLVPDFLTGGLMDASEYDDGKGKVKLRVKMDLPDPKTIVIREICYGTTTESLIRSIDEAAKRGKIKIEAISDYTAEKVEIEIKLPRGQYAEDTLPSLYAYTDCEVTIHSQIVVIKDQYPWEPTIHEILLDHAEKLEGYLKAELTIEKDRLSQKIFDKTLEQIFIENRLYKPLETVSSVAEIDLCVEKGLEPFYPHLSRIPVKEDRDRLLAIPIRRISRFDIEQNQKDIAALTSEIAAIEKNLQRMKAFTVNYLKGLLKKYGHLYPRKTALRTIEELDKRAILTRSVKVGYDSKTGFLGTKVMGDTTLDATNFDKILLLYNNGTYQVINIPEKMYIQNEGNALLHLGIADKSTVFSVVYADPKTHLYFAKRFVVSQFILDKTYRFLDEGMLFKYMTTTAEVSLKLQLVPKPKQKVDKVNFALGSVLVKNVSAKGVRISNRPVKKILAP